MSTIAAGVGAEVLLGLNQAEAAELVSTSTGLPGAGTLAVVLAKAGGSILTGLGVNLWSSRLESEAANSPLNHDLAMASGRAIAASIEDHLLHGPSGKRSKEARDGLSALRKAVLAAHSPEVLERHEGDLEVPVIPEDILSDPQGFLDRAALSESTWSQYLKDLAHRSRDVRRWLVASSIRTIAGDLAVTYSRRLYQELKTDFATEGKAFASATFQQLSAVLRSISESHADLDATAQAAWASSRRTRRDVATLRHELDPTRLHSSLEELKQHREDVRGVAATLSAQIAELPSVLERLSESTEDLVITASLQSSTAKSLEDAAGDSRRVAELMLKTASTLSDQSPEAAAAILTAPVAPSCVGRDPIITEIESHLATQANPRIYMFGDGGVGKSTVAANAVNCPDVRQRFGSRRVRVRCDGIQDGASLTGKIAASLGVIGRENQQGRILKKIKEAPLLLVIDDFEAVWERDWQGASATLDLLAGQRNLALVVTSRRPHAPVEIQWTKRVKIPLLTDAFAVDVLLHYAEQPNHERNSAIHELADVAEGLPLVLMILGRLLYEEGDAAAVVEQWSASCDVVLPGVPRAVAGRRDSLGRSIALSLESPTMTGDGRRLFSMLGVLPSGLDRSGRRALLSESQDHGIALFRHGLCHADGARHFLLRPIREFAAKHYPPSVDDWESVKRLMLGLATANYDDRTHDEHVRDHVANIECVLQSARDADIPEFIDAVPMWAQKVIRNGIGTVAPIEWLFERADLIGLTEGRARCAAYVANIALSRYDVASGRAWYETALELFRSLEHAHGMAFCIEGLGDADFREWRLAQATQRYSEALDLYQEAGKPTGIANCLRGLADAAQREQVERARVEDMWQEAIVAYKRLGTGEARAIALDGRAHACTRLGELCHEFGELDRAESSYSKAGALYEELGDKQGTAIVKLCRSSLLRTRGKHDEAIAHARDALALYEEIRDTEGQAAVHHSLAKIDLELENRVRAGRHLAFAVSLYEAVEDRFSCGHCLADLARLADDEGERRAHARRAIRCWMEIERYALIDEHKLEELAARDS